VLAERRFYSPPLTEGDEGEGEYYNRFYENFMFQLTGEEYNSLRFQIGILKRG